MSAAVHGEKRVQNKHVLLIGYYANKTDNTFRGGKNKDKESGKKSHSKVQNDCSVNILNILKNILSLIFSKNRARYLPHPILKRDLS